MPYTDLTIDEGAATGNTAATVIGQFLVGSDTLAEAVDFTIAKKSGTSGTGPDPGTNVTIDPATGTITIAPAQTAFTATTYTVTMTGKGHYKDSKEADITLTVNATSTAASNLWRSGEYNREKKSTNTGSRPLPYWPCHGMSLTAIQTPRPSTRSTRTT